MFWDTEQTKSFAVSWLKSILLYNYGAGNKRRWEMSYSRVSLFSLLAKSRILSFTRNIWRKMSFQVKFQFKIRQKCCSKWNDIGHTLELGSLQRKFWPYSIKSTFVRPHWFNPLLRILLGRTAPPPHFPQLFFNLSNIVEGAPRPLLLILQKKFLIMYMQIWLNW